MIEITDAKEVEAAFNRIFEIWGDTVEAEEYCTIKVEDAFLICDFYRTMRGFFCGETRKN